MRKTLPRRPRKPLARARTFLCRARAVTPRLTRGILLLLVRRDYRPALQPSERQHLRHVTHVGLMHIHRTPQVALVLGGLLGQDVTFEGLTALDGATGTNAKTLLRAALGLHLGHWNAPS